MRYLFFHGSSVGKKNAQRSVAKIWLSLQVYAHKEPLHRDAEVLKELQLVIVEKRWQKHCTRRKLPIKALPGLLIIRSSILSIRELAAYRRVMVTSTKHSICTGRKGMRDSEIYRMRSYEQISFIGQWSNIRASHEFMKSLKWTRRGLRRGSYRFLDSPRRNEVI